MLPKLRRMGGLPQRCDVNVYEEVKSEPTLMVDELSPGLSFQQQEIDNGDIIIFQARSNPNDSHRFPTAPQYLRHMLTVRKVSFKRLSMPQVRLQSVGWESWRDVKYRRSFSQCRIHHFMR